MIKIEHQCKAERCAKIVPKQLVMCPQHWKMVPWNLKQQIVDSYENGARHQSEVFNDLVEYAIKAVNETELKDIVRREHDGR